MFSHEIVSERIDILKLKLALGDRHTDFFADDACLLFPIRDIVTKLLGYDFCELLFRAIFLEKPEPLDFLDPCERF